MQTLISYSSDSRAYVAWLAEGRPSSRPSDVPFGCPMRRKKVIATFCMSEDKTKPLWDGEKSSRIGELAQEDGKVRKLFN